MPPKPPEEIWVTTELVNLEDLSSVSNTPIELCNVVQTMINHPCGRFIPNIYGGLGDDILLFWPHFCINHVWPGDYLFLHPWQPSRVAEPHWRNFAWPPPGPGWPRLLWKITEKTWEYNGTMGLWLQQNVTLAYGRSKIISTGKTVWNLFGKYDLSIMGLSLDEPSTSWCRISASQSIFMGDLTNPNQVSSTNDSCLRFTLNLTNIISRVMEYVLLPLELISKYINLHGFNLRSCGKKEVIRC